MLKEETRWNIALVSHDNKKKDLLEWAEYNKNVLKEHNLFGTGTTGKLIEDRLGLKVHKYKSGPLGGDAQIIAAIVEERIDMLIFFWDGLTSHPHDVDVKALLRNAVNYNIPVACNRASADFFISSPLLEAGYKDKHTVPVFSERIEY